MDAIKYRVYADGSVLHEDDFAEADNAQPFYDDFKEYRVPEVVILHIAEATR